MRGRSADDQNDDGLRSDRDERNGCGDHDDHDVEGETLVDDGKAICDFEAATDVAEQAEKQVDEGNVVVDEKAGLADDEIERVEGASHPSAGLRNDHD